MHYVWQYQQTKMFFSPQQEFLSFKTAPSPNRNKNPTHSQNFIILLECAMSPPASRLCSVIMIRTCSNRARKTISQKIPIHTTQHATHLHRHFHNNLNRTGPNNPLINARTHTYKERKSARSNAASQLSQWGSDVMRHTTPHRAASLFHLVTLN